MAKHRIVFNWSVLGQGPLCVVVRATNPVRIRESLEEELLQKFTVFHEGICHTCFDAQTSPFDDFGGGSLPLPPECAGERPAHLFRHPLCGDTPQRPQNKQPRQLPKELCS